MPPEMVAHLVGRAYGASPEQVRKWDEHDVYRELLLVTAEGAGTKKRMHDASNARGGWSERP